MTGMNLMMQLFGYIVCGLLGLFSLTAIIYIWLGRLDISQLINETNGKASLSRFQLLMFTFVIASSYLGVILVRGNSGGLPDVPRSVLILLGISAGTYLASKAISYSQSEVILGSPADESQITSGFQVRHYNFSWVPPALTFAMVAFLGVAVYRHEVSASLAALLALIGGLTAWFLVLFLQAVDQDGPPQFETNWGGLGGGLGGWRFSASLIYLICFLVAAVVVCFAFLRR